VSVFVRECVFVCEVESLVFGVESLVCYIYPTTTFTKLLSDPFAFVRENHVRNGVIVADVRGWV
jgi:hypothetical protein